MRLPCPCGGAIGGELAASIRKHVSIRAPRAGGDGRGGARRVRWARFNPRPPCGGRFDFCPWCWRVKRLVSIRAPRAGGDSGPNACDRTPSSFNPRPPCGGRSGALGRFDQFGAFQSAPPVRGAIGRAPRAWRRHAFQSAPPVRGAIHRSANNRTPLRVSIRAPRAGGDASSATTASASSQFQSAPPVRGAITADPDNRTPRTFQSAPPVRGAIQGCGHGCRRRCVSIRAPRAGGDGRHNPSGHHVCCFNPRPPCGGRLSTSHHMTFGSVFQSAPPVRGAMTSSAVRYLG